MKKKTIEKINKNTMNLRRSNSKKWLIDAIILNPNVIIVCAKETKNDWKDAYKLAVSYLKTKPKVKPKFIGINESFKELNLKNKPIIFDSYLIIH